MAEKDERNLEQVYRSAVNGLYARIRSNYDFIYGKYGDDGIKIIADMSREYGLSIAERAKNKLNNPHSMSKCNSGDLTWRFIAQAFPGSVVNL